MTLDEFFAGWDESRLIFEALRAEIEAMGPGRFMHYLELRSESEIDEEVCGWLREACAEAG